MLLPDLFAAKPENAPAISGGGLSLTYGGLGAHAARIMRALRGFGLGRGDVLAMVLPTGPEMAVLFPAVAGVCAAAPLNPAYSQAEFAFYLEDLQAKALLVAEGEMGPAVAAASALGLPLLRLHAGLEISGPAAEGAAEAPQASDTALLLHTSGTTSRPKLVPLTHANLIASAGNIARALQLSPADRCLSLMPLFHIHGLVAGVLANLHAGASLHVSAFNALRFFAQMEEARPSWYTGVPTMHQAILARAGAHAGLIAANPLRFIRSSSASLPVPVFEEMERVFGCPVIEAYSMTENAHQMTSNELPPGLRKPGLVGRAAGPEVAVMAADGRLLGPGEEGEVVTRGPNVTPGYLRNVAANQQSFSDGWFRTGDQGVLDADGFLRITGRLKEIINRGGEKISPLEVDEALLRHPAVAQAVSFAMPHPKLGEEVAAAVVLREGTQAGEGELREFLAQSLAPFKLPARVLILADIPKGPTGKIQRIGLAARLGLT